MFLIILFSQLKTVLQFYFVIPQKAHVGVGISGVEGLQAACASDYAIAQVGDY